MYRKNSILRFWNYLRLQAPTGGLGMHPTGGLWISEDYCSVHMYLISLFKIWDYQVLKSPTHFSSLCLCHFEVSCQLSLFSKPHFQPSYSTGRVMHDCGIKSSQQNERKGGHTKVFSKICCETIIILVMGQSCDIWQSQLKAGYLVINCKYKQLY